MTVVSRQGDLQLIYFTRFYTNVYTLTVFTSCIKLVFKIIFLLFQNQIKNAVCFTISFNIYVDDLGRLQLTL